MDNKKSYSLENLIKMIGNEHAVVIDFISLFLDSSGETLTELNKSFNTNDYSKMGSCAHKLKSSVDLMGIYKLKDDIRKLEHIAKEQINLEEVPKLIEKVNFEIKQVHSEIRTDFSL